MRTLVVAGCLSGLVACRLGPDGLDGDALSDQWPAQLASNEHAAPVDATFSYTERNCTAPPAADVFDDDDAHWLQIRLFDVSADAVVHDSLTPGFRGYSLRNADETGSEDGGPMLVWVRPLSGDTALVCDGESAAGALVVVGAVNVELLADVGDREELRAQMAERVESAGLRALADDVFMTHCSQCTDNISPP